MNVCIVLDAKIPAPLYGGTERVVIWLGKALSRLGHRVSYLARPGSTCSFAPVYPLDRSIPLDPQIPKGTDIVHVHSGDLPNDFPGCMTIHGNTAIPRVFPPNSIFVSESHARNHNAQAFVYNGLDPDEYGPPALDHERSAFVFLGKAAWRIKNVKGAIGVARRAGAPIEVLGGSRLNFKMGFRLTLDPNARFHGMVGGERKNALLRNSLGLIFPLLWDEPFGIAITENLYYGAPVFGTPYGSLPELVPEFAGRLERSLSGLAEAAAQARAYDRRAIHDWCLKTFTADQMAAKYLMYYERILSGETLHPGPVQAPATRSKKLFEWGC